MTLLLLLLLLLFISTFVQSISSYLPETIHVCRVYSVASILYLQFMLRLMIFPMLTVLYFTQLLSEVCGQG